MVKRFFLALCVYTTLAGAALGGQPTPYSRQHNFTDHTQNFPTVPQDGGEMDDEFNAIKGTLDDTLDNLQLIQRDDGELANDSVGLDQLQDDINLGVNPVGDWLTATAYSVNDAVWQDRILYRCLIAHTSGTFATDLAAVKWEALLDFDVYIDLAESAATTAGAAATTASSAATTASTASSSATNSATTASGASSAATASASAAATSETNAASSAATIIASWKGPWVTATGYAVGEKVSNGGSSYISISQHTSGATTEPGVGVNWTTRWNLMAQKGASGVGAGDMVGANNLTDVADPASAFGNIKQASSLTVSGVCELANSTEVQTGTDSVRCISPASLSDRSATETRTGLVELATDAEVQTGTDTARAITAANLTARTATTTRTGIVELATDAETITGTDTARAITPSNLQAKVSSSTAKGIVELATDAEAITGTDTARATTPANITAVLANLGLDNLGTASAIDIDTDGTLAANSDAKIATQKAVKTYVDGTASGDFVLTATATASSSATLDFTGQSSSCSAYKYILSGIRPSSDGVALYIRTSANSGSTYDSSSSHYTYREKYFNFDGSAAEILTANASLGRIVLASTGVGNGASLGTGSEQMNGEITLYNPSSTTNYGKFITGSYEWIDGGGSRYMGQIYGNREAITAINGIRFQFSAGNISSGKIYQYCLQAS